MSLNDDPLARLQRFGANSLTPWELLAVLLDEPDDERGRQLMAALGGIRGLADVDSERLAKCGFGNVEAARVLAALRLGRSVEKAGLGERTSIVSAMDVSREFRYLRDERREHVVAIYLDAKRNILRTFTISIGVLNSTLVHPREVFREAIREGACSLILAHNHPSGDPEPSREDHEVTKELAAAGKLLGIPLDDHVILGDGEDSYVSMKERGVF